jgi:hypothetical protein
MKRIIGTCVLVCGMIVLPTVEVSAQDPITLIIKEGIKKIIKAVDLKIQRLQNKTIWLQNAQKTLENKMQQLKLDQITGWVERQRKLYEDYYDELWRVKAAISYYSKVKDIMAQQVQIVNEYKAALALFRQDKRFTPEELATMQKVYEGMLQESVKNLEGLTLVVNSFATQMSDGARLQIIHEAGTRVEENLADLRQFTARNKQLSLARAKDQREIDLIKALYGIK